MHEKLSRFMTAMDKYCYQPALQNHIMHLEYIMSTNIIAWNSYIIIAIRYVIK